MSKKDNQMVWREVALSEDDRVRGDWKVNSRRTWEGAYGIRLFHDKVTRPDGSPGVYEWIDITGGVVILPMDENRDVYLAQGFQYGFGDYNLELAGGGIEEGETPRQAAERELREELGIKTGQLIDLGQLNQMTGLLYSPQTLFVAKDISFGEMQQETTEKITRVRMPLEKAVEYACNGEIHEALTVATILRANEHLRN